MRGERYFAPASIIPHLSQPRLPSISPNLFLDPIGLNGLVPNKAGTFPQYQPNPTERIIITTD
ncbi:MAG TPA: hypothetical protein PKE64_09125 [Anaerolineae bacterium]|nr:hypothetical protein [Anaerolineae bacterium]HMR64159.1 hypothetical protein [Anaerolineae bacterium]